MKYTYSEGITCLSCGSSDITTDYAPRGIGYCTCRSCGKKFVIQSDGNNLIDSYLAERGRIFTELETAKLNGKSLSSVKRGLENLVRSHAVLADIDPIYYWYKIDMITDGFKDFSQYKKAEKEFLNIPKANYFFVDREDIGRNEAYLERYENYINEYNAQSQAEDKKKRRKKKAILISVMTFLCAAVIGSGLFVGLYRPEISDNSTGVSVKVNTLSNGLFDKFSATAKIAELDPTDDVYVSEQTALSPVTRKFKSYDISLLKDGTSVKPKSDVEILVPVPKDYHREKMCVYSFDGENLKEIKHSFSKDGKIVFNTKKLGVFAIAELPYTISFDGNGSDYSENVPVYFNEAVEKPSDPVRRGYTFGGWLCGETQYDFSEPVSKDLTITAQWSANTYTVKFYVDGNKVDEREVVFGSNVSLYQYSKTGYTVQWYDGQTLVKDGAWDIAYDVSLTAKEIPNEYNVKLISGVSACCPALSEGDGNVTATYDKTLPQITIPRRTGYTFEGYYTRPDGAGEKYIDASGNGLVTWTFTNTAELYAKWTLDEKYNGYTYISAYSELTTMNANGKYLLIKDIDMNGSSWTPIRSFGGTFDGGNHMIYNFRITNGVAEDGLVLNFGLFGWVSGSVKNLQIGKSGTTTSIEHDEWHKRYNAGMIAGYCTGTIYNCRVVSCSITLHTFAQDHQYERQEFWINAGGVCGNLYEATVEKCHVDGTSVSSRVEVRYNVIPGTARAAGIAGFVNSASVLDCLAKKCDIYAWAKSNDGAWGNWSGKPHSRAGCIVGTMVKWGSKNAVISRCVEAANSIAADIQVGSYTDNVDNNTGTRYAGAIIGETGTTSPSDLIGVNSGLQCSGCDSGYPAFTKITQDSYDILIQTSSAFKNGKWISDGGKISLDFYGN